MASPTSLPPLRLRAARIAGEPRARSVSSSARSGGRRPSDCGSTASRSSTYAPKTSGFGCGSCSLSDAPESSPSRHARRNAGSSGSSRSGAAHSHRSSMLPACGFGSPGSASSASTRARSSTSCPKTRSPRGERSMQVDHELPHAKPTGVHPEVHRMDAAPRTPVDEALPVGQSRSRALETHLVFGNQRPQPRVVGHSVGIQPGDPPRPAFDEDALVVRKAPALDRHRHKRHRSLRALIL